MKIISVINYKGGVGKTALTANLGAELAFRGEQVLLIDLDPQASLTFSFVSPDYWESKLAADKTIKNWFAVISGQPVSKFDELIVQPTRVNNAIKKGKLSLVPSHLELINVDLELATQLAGTSLRQSKVNFIKTHMRLVEGIKQIEEGRFSVILIDCPPNFNIVTKNAIVASDYILIPAKPDYLSTLGINYLRRSMEGLVRDYNEYTEVESSIHFDKINPEILGVVFTMLQFWGGQPISNMRPYIEQTKSLKVPVFDAYIRENKTLFASTPQYGVPVVLNNYSPNTTYSTVREELEQLATEFLRKI